MPSVGAGRAGMYKSMRKEAAKLGANAVVLTELYEPGLATKAVGVMFGFNAERRARGLAIYVPPLPKTSSGDASRRPTE